MSSLDAVKRRAALVVLTAGLAALVAGCGGGSSSSSDPTTTTASSADYSGATANPPKPAPPLQLNNYLGQPVNIKDYRGKAVLVLFIYDHCPDICPLMVSNLHAAQNQMSAQKRKEMQIIAVSVDPKGDTPKTVKNFLADHQMTGRMQYLIGSPKQLQNVWVDWNIRTKNAPGNSNPDRVAHSALVYGISGTGDITTLYPANFKPDQIVHDVPKLASS
jgi:protein SCO1/2